MTLSIQETAADYRLRKTYGITLAEYDRVLAYQGGACAICKRVPAPGKPRLAVDHDHRTGLLRGLLCWLCNRAIGKFHDDTQRLVNAAEYVTNPPMTIVFKQARYTAPGSVGTKKRAKLLNPDNYPVKDRNARKKPKKPRQKPKPRSARRKQKSV